MKKFIIFLALGFMVFTGSLNASETIIEDAEDGTTAGWSVYDNNPSGATISNVVDEAQGKVIALNGVGLANGYMLGHWGSEGFQTAKKKLSWKMKYNERFSVYIIVWTEDGNRYLWYTPEDTDIGLALGGRYVHHGLGADALNGQWHIFQRDLEADLKEYSPELSVLEIKAFLIRGSGYVDDIVSSDDFNHALTANAGADQGLEITTPTTTVTLDGTASTAGSVGSIVQYEWFYNGISLGTGATLDVNDVDPGTYTVTLTITDSLGHTSSDTVNVTVILNEVSDTTNPVITLLGDENISVVKGTNYIDAGATATDNIDGDISSEIAIDNPVDTNAEIGTKFVVTYSVFDNAGNSATATRSITIVRDLDISLTDWIANGDGNWVLQGDNKSVKQTRNGNPTLYHNNVDSQSNLFKLSGQITVQTSSDDDFIGFVLGYHDDDINKDDVDYLLIDWKQGNQTFNSLGHATRGLAISRVNKKLENPAAWIHSSEDGVTELQRATSLGDTGWTDNTTYTFEITFTETLVEVFIDGVKELSVSGIFNDGAYGFYNYSQENVLYSAIEVNIGSEN